MGKILLNEIQTAYNYLLDSVDEAAAKRHLANVLDWFKAAQILNMQDPQLFFRRLKEGDAPAMDLLFFDTHTVGSTTSCRQLDQVVRQLEKAAADDNNLKDGQGHLVRRNDSGGAARAPRKNSTDC